MDNNNNNNNQQQEQKTKARIRRRVRTRTTTTTTTRTRITTATCWLSPGGNKPIGRTKGPRQIMITSSYIISCIGIYIYIYMESVFDDIYIYIYVISYVAGMFYESRLV